MPRIEVAGFVGGLGSLKSRSMGSEDLWNGIVEPTAPTHGKTPGYLRRIPGVRPFATLGDVASIRGLYAQDGRMFAVGGTIFTEVFDDGSLGVPQTVLEDANPATISQGQAEASPAVFHNALLVVSGGNGIVYDLVTNSAIPISAPGLTPPYSMGLVIDTYGVVVKADSTEFNFSAVGNFASFDALDFAARSEASDNISFMVRSHRELVMMGTLTGEVWQDDGVTPFSPIAGVFIEQGSMAAYAGLGVDNTVYWLGRNTHGGAIVYRLNGYTPERVSNYAVEFALSHSTRLSETIAFSLEMGGHLFYALYVPDLIGLHQGGTLVYDVSTGIWARWAIWNSDLAIFEPWFGRCHCFAFDKHFIGDRSSGTIYEVSFDLYDNEVAD